MTTTHYSTMTFTDKTGEPTTVKIYNDAVTALSIAAYLAQLGTLRTATGAITLGAQSRATWVGDADDTPVDTSALPNTAQRENKLLVTYEDTTTHEQYQLSIGTIDLTKLSFVPGAKDAVLLTAPTEIVDWITAFEAIASPPEAPANGVKVLKMRFVGRNS